jgi:hypothetical protein
LDSKQTVDDFLDGYSLRWMLFSKSLSGLATALRGFFPQSAEMRPSVLGL